MAIFTIKPLEQLADFAWNNLTNTATNIFTNITNSIRPNAVSTIKPTTRPPISQPITQPINLSLDKLISAMTKQNADNRNNLNKGLGLLESRISSNIRTSSKQISNSIASMEYSTNRSIKNASSILNNSVNRLSEQNKHNTEKIVRGISSNFDKSIAQIERGLIGGLKSSALLEAEGEKLIAAQIENLVRTLKGNAKAFPEQLQKVLIATRPQEIDDFTIEEINALGSVLGETLSNVLVEFIETKEFKDVIKKVKDDPIGELSDTANIVESIFRILGILGGEAIEAVSAIIPILASIAPTFILQDIVRSNLEPFIRHVYNRASQVARSDLFPMERSAILGQLFPDKREWAEKQLQFHGLANEAIDNLFESIRTPLTENDLRELYIRGLFGAEQIREHASRIGIDSEVLSAKIKLWKVLPTINDLIRFAVRDVYDPEVVRQAGLDEGIPPQLLERAQEIGLPEELLREYWAAHFTIPSVGQGFAMFQRRIINRDRLESLFKAADIAPGWRDDLLKLSYNVITRVDVRRMHLLGVLNDTDVYNKYLDIGYNPEDARIMTEWTKKYNARSTQFGGDRVKELSQSVVLKGLAKGTISREQAITRLQRLGYDYDDAITLIDIAIEDNTVDAIPNKLRDNFSRIERSVSADYIKGVIDQKEAGDRLAEIGFSSADIEAELIFLDIERETQVKAEIGEAIKSQYISYVITTEQARNLLNNEGFAITEIDRIIRSWEIVRKNRSRNPTVANVKSWFAKGIIDQNRTIRYLKGMEYSDETISYYIRDWSE